MNSNNIEEPDTKEVSGTISKIGENEIEVKLDIGPRLIVSKDEIDSSTKVKIGQRVVYRSFLKTFGRHWHGNQVKKIVGEQRVLVGEQKRNEDDDELSL